MSIVEVKSIFRVIPDSLKHTFWKSSRKAFIMQRASICHGSDIFRKRFSSFCWHIRMSRYSLSAFFCQRPWRAVGLLVLFEAICCYGLIKMCAGPHLPILTGEYQTGGEGWEKGSCFLPPSLPFPLPNASTCLSLIFLPSTPPPGLRLSTCGPLPHLNFFTPPPFGRTPDALTQSRLFAWEGVPFSPRPHWFVCEEIHMHLCLKLREHI